MSARLWPLSISVVTVLVPVFSNPAGAVAAKIPIVILWGSGEELVPIGELPVSVADGVNKEIGADVSIGFLYERFHVFWCDVWTWNGRYVLFAENKYWELEPEMWKKLLNSDVSAQFDKPIQYTIPLGSGILVVLCGVWVAGNRLFKSDVQRVQALLKDDRYRSATEKLLGPAGADATSSADERPYEEKFLEAVRYLVGEGIPQTKAEANLAKIANVVEASRQQRIDQLFAVAAQLDQEGEWDKSTKVGNSRRLRSFNFLFLSAPSHARRCTGSSRIAFDSI